MKLKIVTDMTACECTICYFLFQTLLRIWDCVFYEGSKIIFRVALTLIKLHQDQLLECQTFTDVVDVFKAMPRHAIVTHCHKFLKVG